jgi:hypothetical protein
MFTLFFQTADLEMQRFSGTLWRMAEPPKYREQISFLEIAEGRFPNALVTWKCEHVQIGKHNLRRSFELHIWQGQVRNG